MTKVVDVAIVRIVKVRKGIWAAQACENNLMLVTNLLPELFNVFWFHHYDEVIRQELELVYSFRFVGPKVQTQFFTEFRGPGVCREADTAIKAAGIRVDPQAPGVIFGKRAAADVTATDKHDPLIRLRHHSLIVVVPARPG
jgi:hypothetical protein